MIKTFAGGDLVAERFGTGSPHVLALHGWRRDRHDWPAVLHGLDALALDQPGFGASPPPPRGWGSADYATATLPVLEALESPRVLLGHSFGGRVAVQLAATHPELVDALVLTGVPLVRRASSTRPPLAYALVRRLHALRLLPDTQLERARRRHGSADYRAASGVMRDVLVRVVNESYERELAQVRCPVQLVWGALDTTTPPGVVDAARPYLAVEPALTVVPGAGHLTPTEAPAALRAAVETALAPR